MFDDAHRIVSGAFMPHGMCYLWRPDILGLHLVSDSLIALAYFSIPFTLVYFVRRRGDLQFSWMFVCFAVFIVACGGTHLMEIWTIWHPDYWWSGSIKALTALASVPTAILLVKLVPLALQLPSPATLTLANKELQREAAERRRTEEELRSANAQLVRGAALREQAERFAEQFSSLQLLHTITRAIGERQDLRSVFQVVLGTLEDQLPVDFGIVCLTNGADSLTVACAGPKSRQRAADLGLTENVPFPAGAEGLSRSLAGKSIYEPDLGAVHSAFAQRLAAAGLDSMVAAPLLVESKVFGVLLVARVASRGFSAAECEFLAQLSEHVALAAHQAQIYGALQGAYEDLRRTQADVMRHEKLRVLGQMASGIAHDINNALSPASLYVEILLGGVSGLTAVERSYLVTIQSAVEGVTHTIARMKEFYSQHDTRQDFTAVSLNEVAGAVIELTRPRWSSMLQRSGAVIEVTMDLDANLPAISGDASAIRDALTNVVLNAADAMPEGGHLTVRTRAVASGQARVDITDTGIGMDEATRSRCLELFFTTKGDRGTGLGLAMVYGTVERHGGELHIESAPGAGTTMQLFFPLATTVPARSAEPAQRSPQLPMRILAIDDDPMVLQAVGHALRHEGHSVETANGGQEGIEAFRAADARGEPFAAVITDLGMPHVDGRKVAAGIKALRPQCPVILLTGWGHRMIAENETPPNVDRVLGKPPKLIDLRTALAEVTSQPPGD